VTPGITALEYAHRRSKLARQLPTNGIAVVAAADLKFKSGSVFYEFHQSSDFFYLTGNASSREGYTVDVFVEKTGLGDDHAFHLYCRPKDPRAELWEGARSGIQAAQDVFNADETGDINAVQERLPQILRSAGTIYTDISGTAKSKSSFSRYFRGSTPSSDTFERLLEPHAVKPLRPLLNDLRVIKSDSEINLMRRIGQNSGRAITEAMRSHFYSEKDLWSFLEYSFRKQGCDGSAYVPVIAGGAHALSIHYVRNDDILKDGQLVLVDAGGEYGGYITDITRSWPVGGKFSSAEKDLYDVILKVQRSCVSMCREDANTTLDKLHGIAENGLRDGLKQIGFDMSGNALQTLFPHHLGHHVGLDVHDAPGYPRSELLKAGHCITIEPGIYVPDNDRWPKHFRGMGIRIEDSVCVQESAPLILTTEAAKEVSSMYTKTKLCR
ncbi:metallopeptidase family M24, partial [Viridothelium virens]